MGQEARIIESNALLSRRDPSVPLSDLEARGQALFDWHRGEDLETSTGIKNGLLWHSSFVKAIVFLTDTGPDAGTAIIAGSHKINAPVAELAEMVRTEPALLHQIQAEAGDALLFSGASLVLLSPAVRDSFLTRGRSPAEACCHASPELRPDSDGLERAFFAVAFAPTVRAAQGWLSAISVFLI
jgi:hypothetical protein